MYLTISQNGEKAWLDARKPFTGPQFALTPKAAGPLRTEGRRTFLVTFRNGRGDLPNPAGVGLFGTGDPTTDRGPMTIKGYDAPLDLIDCMELLLRLGYASSQSIDVVVEDERRRTDTQRLRKALYHVDELAYVLDESCPDGDWTAALAVVCLAAGRAAPELKALGSRLHSKSRFSRHI